MDVGTVGRPHQVFISFQGDEMGRGFVNDLVEGMKSAGIDVLISMNLQGETALWEVLERMRESRVALVIFSSEYTASKWCLYELVAIKGRMDIGKLTVIPIFYKVEPSSVGGLKGNFGFPLGNPGMNSDMFEKCKAALHSISGKEGFELKEMNDEISFIHGLVEEVRKLLINISVGSNPKVVDDKGSLHDRRMRWLRSLAKPPPHLTGSASGKSEKAYVVVHRDGETYFLKYMFKKRWEDKFRCAPKGNMTKPSTSGELCLEDENHQERIQAALEELKTRETDHICVLFRSDYRDVNKMSLLNDIRQELHLQDVMSLEYSLTARHRLNLGTVMQRRFGVGIIIFSNDFACSRECLDQLEVVMEHRKANDLLMIPVYYKVKPSDIRGQKGTFEEAFLRLGSSYKTEKVQKWRAAINETVSVDGIEWTDGNERLVAKNIVEKACLRLYSRTSKNLVDVLSYVDRSLPSGLQILGIWGMAGVGKTTIAREIFQILAPRYDSCYFLQDFQLMRQMKGINRLRDEFVSKIFGEENLGIAACNIKPSFMRDMFRRKKLLIVLDDVSNARDAKALVGGFGWFSPGHRIILTSRKRQVLVQCNVEEPYEMQGLSVFESFRLSHLYLKAEVSSILDIMDYANGIPLALMVYASSAQKHHPNNMKEHLQELRRNPPTEIREAFQRSFDGLNENEKNVFLDLVCFFRGENKDYVGQLLDACGFFTDLGICGLTNESLVTLFDNRIGIHNIVQDMGRFVVREEDKDPGRRSRLWDAQDITDVLTNNSGTEAIEGIFLDASSLMCELDPTVFNNMYSLRLLKVYCSSSGNQCKLCLPQGLESLPDELRLLHWENYPLKSLPRKFNSKNLVELNMPYSIIEKLWEGVENLQKLKKLRLSHSRQLTEFPRFTKPWDLEHIDLEGCTSLVEVSSSIHYLGKLVVLNLKDCSRLQSVPAMIRLESLQVLNLSGCSELENVQDFSKNLKELYLAGTAIREVPSSIENLAGLAVLDLENCKRLLKLPLGMNNLKSLTTFKHSGCSNLDSLQNLDATHLRHVQHINVTEKPTEASTTSLSHNSAMPLISHHSTIQESSLNGSEILLNSHTSQLRSDVDNICMSNNEKEQAMEADYVSLFQGVGQQWWHLGRSILLSLESRWYALVSLLLCNANLLHVPEGICWLSSLKALNLGGNGFSKLPESLKDLPKLHSLTLRHCRNLISIPELPQSVELLNAHGCVSLTSIHHSFMRFSRHYTFSNCFNLSPEVVRPFLGKVVDSVGSMTTENLKVLPAFSICVPASAGRISSSYLGIGSRVVFQLTPSMRRTLLGFAISVVVAFRGNYHNAAGFGIRRICRWKTEKGHSHTLERVFHFWAPREAPKIKKDHMFVFCDAKMHPGAGEGNDLNILAGPILFECYPVDEHNNLLDNSCMVMEYGVSVISSPTSDIKHITERPASFLDPLELSDKEDMQPPYKRTRLSRFLQRKREQSSERFRDLAKARGMLVLHESTHERNSQTRPFGSTMSRDRTTFPRVSGEGQSQDHPLDTQSRPLINQPQEQKDMPSVRDPLLRLFKKEVLYENFLSSSSKLQNPVLKVPISSSDVQRKEIKTYQPHMMPSKEEIQWTPEINEAFVEAVKQLSGIERATPKAVLKLMDHPGLTIYHVKGRLQKYRMLQSKVGAKRSPRNNSGSLDNATESPDSKMAIGSNEALQPHVEVQKSLPDPAEDEATD